MRKSLYLYKHHYDTKDDVSNAQQAIFDQGNEAGILAQQLFPNGVDVSPCMTTGIWRTSAKDPRAYPPRRNRDL